MTLEEVIYKRKSCRSYQKKDLSQEDIQLIEERIQEIKPLYPNIKYSIQIEKKENVSCLLPFATNQMITVFSEKKPGYGLNTGFIVQQLVLYMNSIGISSCWIGLSGYKNKHTELEFVISLSIGYAKKEPFRDISKFNRKDWSQFSDRVDPRLEVARLAPSSMNSQPWYFTHDEEFIHMWYIPQRGFGKSFRLKPSEFNEIDLGIALAHLHVTYPNMTFEYRLVDPYLNYKHICAFKLNGGTE